MRTTLDIDDELLRRAKEVAARTDRPLRAVVEDALRQSFRRTGRRRRGSRVKLKVAKRGGAVRPGVNLDSWASLLDAMEGPDAPS